jgi:C4-dicarboxylate-specific signal transduction histidine kinase
MMPTGTAHLPRERIVAEPSMAPTRGQADAFIEEALRSLPGGGAPREVAIEKELISPRRAVAAVERATVLVADDNADMLEYVRRLLAERYEVEAVPDGQAALDAARARRPDLILTDVMMPRLDGFGLLQAIRTDGALRDVPVILLSARAGEEAKVGGLEAGADDYLLKPFSARELIARVDANLQLARLRRETGESERRYRQTQAELARVTRVITLGELTASIAHEVYQPLAAVDTDARACRNWLNRATPDLDEARGCLEMIMEASNRACEVIGRIRTLAKKAEVERVAVGVNDVIQEVIALVQGELSSHLVSLQLELAPTLPTIMADRVHLQQVVMNLVMNGIEAMQSVTDRPRQLVIQSSLEETHQVHISVTDSGVGISTENAGRLFEAFFTTKSSGMGMGLSICRSIIEAHGGRLWVTSNVPFGATFEFTLPVNADHAA